MARDGYPTRETLVERYEAQTGLQFEHETFYRVLAVYKLAALGQMFYRRYLEGNSGDPRWKPAFRNSPHGRSPSSMEKSRCDPCPNPPPAAERSLVLARTTPFTPTRCLRGRQQHARSQRGEIASLDSTLI